MKFVHVMLLWDSQAVPKRQFLTTNQRCVTSQKNEDLDTLTWMISVTTKFKATK